MAAATGKLLLFGAAGAIGSGIRDLFQARGWTVVSTGRQVQQDSRQDSPWVTMDPFGGACDWPALEQQAPFAGVIWAQGANLNDSVYDVDLQAHTALYQANCLYILATLQPLLARGLLAPAARMCIISSIWQNIARQDKLSYCMTKAALQGLVMSASADLAAEGYLINAILPGALNTEMTRQNLSAAQLDALQAQTRFGRLATVKDVASLAYFLCSDDNNSLTGQFIATDLGFSHVRLL